MRCARRYEAMVVGDSRKRDLSQAEAYYFQATDVFPEGAHAERVIPFLNARSEPWSTIIFKPSSGLCRNVTSLDIVCKLGTTCSHHGGASHWCLQPKQAGVACVLSILPLPLQRRDILNTATSNVPNSAIIRTSSRRPLRHLLVIRNLSFTTPLNLVPRRQLLQPAGSAGDVHGGGAAGRVLLFSLPGDRASLPGRAGEPAPALRAQPRQVTKTACRRSRSCQCLHVLPICVWNERMNDHIYPAARADEDESATQSNHHHHQSGALLRLSFA